MRLWLDGSEDGNMFAPESEATLRLAREEAAASGQDRVATEHLLLGLLRDDDGVTARELEEADVSLANARERVQAFSEPEDGWEPR